MDEVCCQRVDPQDLNNPLHMDGHPGAGAGTGHDDDEDNHHEAEQGVEEEDHSPDDDQDDATDGHGPDGPARPSAEGTTLAPGSAASGSLADPMDALMGPSSGDPLHMIRPVTATTAAENPFSTRPGDWVYEADEVSFNLSAAGRCLEATRRTVEALCEGNRHRRGSGGETSRSRSRSPRRDSDNADRRGVNKTAFFYCSCKPLPHCPQGPAHQVRH